MASNGQVTVYEVLSSPQPTSLHHMVMAKSVEPAVIDSLTLQKFCENPVDIVYDCLMMPRVKAGLTTEKKAQYTTRRPHTRLRVLGETTMIQSIFSKPRVEIDDDVLEAANQALQDRVAMMLQRETIRKLKFARVECKHICVET